MQQLPLVLEHRKMLTREDFLISFSNMEAVEWIDLYPDWIDVFAVMIVGARMSGKTHLLYLFSEKTNAKVYEALTLDNLSFYNIVPTNSAIAIDNIDKIAGNFKLEEQLFHIINYSLECRTKLLLTSSVPCNNIKWSILDLKTRLNTLPVANIYPPDDELIKNLFVKQITEADIIVNPDCIEYLTKNIERSYNAIFNIIEKLKRISLVEKHKITIPFIKTILNKN